MSQAPHSTCAASHRQEFQPIDINAASPQFSGALQPLTDAQKSLVERHTNVAIGALASLKLPAACDPYGAGRQEALYACVRAVLSYDPSRSTSLETWIYSKVRWELLEWCRTHATRSARCALLPDMDAPANDNVVQDAADTELEQAVDEALSAEPPALQTAARALLRGEGPTAIGRYLGIGDRAASRLAADARRVLTAVLITSR